MNEHLDVAGGAPTDISGLICECGDLACTAVLAVQHGEYERVRSNPERFFVAPADSHVDVTVERVVERRDGYWVVEKFGRAGDVAEELDPRS